MKVSIVVPTYNRGTKLKATLDSLLSENVSGIGEGEIIVVDDGSATPASTIVQKCSAAIPFTLRCLRQPNRGPAAARNAGFRAARGDIVIFIDDDIICPPMLIQNHLAAHSLHPRSVVCGRCPPLAPHPVTSLYCFIKSLSLDPGETAGEEFVVIDVAASGQISVERSMFDAGQGVYRDDLSTPAAEEFELSLRLHNRSIPILLGTRIVADHDLPLTIEDLSRQQYKHGFGCAEAALKYPATLAIQSLANVIHVNYGSKGHESGKPKIKRYARRMFALNRSRRGLLELTKVAERIALHSRLLMPLYRLTIGSYFCAGVQEGVRYYSNDKRRKPC